MVDNAKHKNSIVRITSLQDKISKLPKSENGSLKQTPNKITPITPPGDVPNLILKKKMMMELEKKIKINDDPSSS